MIFYCHGGGGGISQAGKGLSRRYFTHIFNPGNRAAIEDMLLMRLAITGDSGGSC